MPKLKMTLELGNIKLRKMTKAELKREGWTGDVLCLELPDGVLLYPSCDYEGNGGGVFFGYDPRNKQSFAI